MSKRGYNTYIRKQIDAEDDIVIVFDEEDNQIYKGIEDYEPMKDCDWKWYNDIQAYKYLGYLKICLDI